MPDLSFGPFVIDIPEGVLRRDGTPVPLTPKAFDLLAALVAQPGRLLSKDQLLAQVWPGAFVEESNVAYNVFALRKALGDTAENAQYIETVPKRGYRFIAAVTSLEGQPARLPEGSGGAPLPASGGPSRLLPFQRVAGELPGPGASSRALMAAGIELPVSQAPGQDTAADAQEPRSMPRRRWPGVATLAALVVPAAYLVAPSWRTPDPDEALRAVPLISVSGMVRAPSLSPDGTYVVFTWDGAGLHNLDLYVQQVGAGEPLRLTTDPASDVSASWSPDGRTIAFLRRHAGAPGSEVWVVAPLGGGERKLADIRPWLPSYRTPTISWCPDSRCVLVTDAAADRKADAIVAITLSGGEKEQVTSPENGGGDADPVISPDGRWLVYRRDTTPFSGVLYRVPFNGQTRAETGPVRLTSTLPAGQVAWMADSRTVLFAARGGLWTLDVLNGGDASRLPFVGHDGTAPAVASTADGTQRLVYVRSVTDTNVWRIDTASPGAPATSPPVLAVSSTRSDHLARLSPDAQRLVFSSDRSGDTEFWLSNIDGSRPLQLTSMAMLPGFPRWSPDGQVIAFHGDPSGRPDVLVVPARGGTPKILTADLPNAGFPSFSRDGQWIYFTVTDGRRPLIWKMPASGGRALQVTGHPGVVSMESTDGKDLYYLEAAERPSALWRQPLAGGAPVKVLDGIIAGNFDVLEGGIYYVDRSPERPGTAADARLRYLDFATGHSTTVSENLGRVRSGLSASADGRMIFFSRLDASVDELMLVEQLRR